MAAVEPFDPTKAEPDIPTPVVVVISDPPETAISGFTRIVIVTLAVAPTLSVAVMVSV